MVLTQENCLLRQLEVYKICNSKYVTKVTVDTIELDSKYGKSDKADKDSVRKLAVKTAKNKVKK